jgi:FAD/FMN-containing dehydrogenase
MTTSPTAKRADFKDLAARLTGQLVLTEEALYEQVRALWNDAVHTRPAAIVQCATVQDVVHTVRWARAHGRVLSVRGGGHDFAGRALCEDGIVIDCSSMRAVIIDPATRTARIQAGATAGDLINAAQQAGLATTTGTVSTVGLAGLTLGGGYGPLMGTYGLVTDNLLSAQVVTANGELMSASAAEEAEQTEHADLLWGLRGGGGNFGVVVSLEYRLHPVTTVWSGLLLYPIEQASATLRTCSEFLATAPDELTIQSGFLQMPDSGPDALPMLFLSPTYCGPVEDGERVLAPLRRVGTPLADQIQPVAYGALITAIDALFPKGRHYFLQTQSLEGLRPETIEILIEGAKRFTAPYSAFSVHHFHGAASRVAVSEAAFAPRQNHLMVEIIAGWEPQSPDVELAKKVGQQHVCWARDISRALAPYALPGGYVNLLDVGEQERVPLTFGHNYSRLLELKWAYDPDDVFQSTIGHVSPKAAQTFEPAGDRA